MLIRLFLYFILSILFAAFQSTVGNFLRIGATPNLLFAMVICVAILRGSLEGGIVGVLCGLLYDFVQFSIIGLYGLIYLYIGVLCGFLCNNLYRDKFFITLGFSVVAAFVAPSIYYFFGHFMWGFDYIDIAFFSHILPEAIYAIATTIPLFFAFRALNRHFTTKKVLIDS